MNGGRQTPAPSAIGPVVSTTPKSMPMLQSQQSAFWNPAGINQSGRTKKRIEEMTDEWNYPYEGHNLGNGAQRARTFSEVTSAQAEAIARYADGDPYATCAQALREAAADSVSAHEAETLLSAAIYLERRGKK